MVAAGIETVADLSMSPPARIRQAGVREDHVELILRALSEFSTCDEDPVVDGK